MKYNFGFYTVNFVYVPGRTTNLILFKVLFPWLFGPKRFGIIYAIFRELTCIY
jgi:hypothetical protein